MSRILLVVICFAITACTTTGTIQGVSGDSAVQFEYEQTLFENDGLLKVTMPKGELFSGKFVQSSSSTSGTDWGLGESNNDDAMVMKDSTTMTSKAEAVLIGNRGSTMTCTIMLSSPEIGFDGGGIGKCETSSGEKVSFTF